MKVNVQLPTQQMSKDGPGSFRRLLILSGAFCARLLQILIDTVHGGWGIAEHSVLDIDPETVRNEERTRLIRMTYLGPWNQFRALTNHQMRMNVIGPPYTRQVQFIPAALGLFPSVMVPVRVETCTYSRSLPVTLGSIRIGTINVTKAQANVPIGILAGPRFHGPGLKRSPTKKTRIAIGIVKATKAATAPIENKAPAASGPPKMRRSITIPIMVLNQTALTGVRVCRLTCLVICDSGPKHSSRE